MIVYVESNFVLELAYLRLVDTSNEGPGTWSAFDVLGQRIKSNPR